MYGMLLIARIRMIPGAHKPASYFTESVAQKAPFVSYSRKTTSRVMGSLF